MVSLWRCHGDPHLTDAMRKRIHTLSALCAVITALAFVVPRFVPNQEGGFASAANAILVFLGMLLVAAVLSLYLLVQTFRAYRDLPWPSRLAGIAPGLILVTGLALLLGVLRY
jgi:hypothetical protein